jgi:hypothetical protein
MGIAPSPQSACKARHGTGTDRPIPAQRGRGVAAISPARAERTRWSRLRLRRGRVASRGLLARPAAGDTWRWRAGRFSGDRQREQAREN